MSSSRRRYSAQYKDEAVQMVVRTGSSIAQVARDLGIVARQTMWQGY